MHKWSCMKMCSGCCPVLPCWHRAKRSVLVLPINIRMHGCLLSRKCCGCSTKRLTDCLRFISPQVVDAVDPRPTARLLHTAAVVPDATGTPFIYVFGGMDESG